MPLACGAQSGMHSPFLASSVYLSSRRYIPAVFDLWFVTCTSSSVSSMNLLHQPSLCLNGVVIFVILTHTFSLYWHFLYFCRLLLPPSHTVILLIRSASPSSLITNLHELPLCLNGAVFCIILTHIFSLHWHVPYFYHLLVTPSHTYTFYYVSFSIFLNKFPSLSFTLSQRCCLLHHLNP